MIEWGLATGGRALRARRTLAATATAALFCALVGVAAADDYRYQRLGPDTKVARSVALRQSDFKDTRGWKATQVTPDHSAPAACDGYLPKRSDLVVTGEAATQFSYRGVATIHSEVGVFKSARMAALDWARNTTGYPDHAACVRSGIERELPRGMRIASVKRLSLTVDQTPARETDANTIGYRVVGTMAVEAHAPIPFLIDFVVFIRGRTEGSVVISMLGTDSASPAAAKALDRHCVAKMTARMR